MDSSLIEIICPINVEWKIKKASLMDLMESENGYFDGKCYSAFNIPGLKYYIKIYPNGEDTEHRGKTRIMFSYCGYVLGKFSGEITLTNESSKFSWLFNSENENSDKCICDTSEFFDSKNNYFVKGEFTIKAEGFFKVEKPPISNVSSPISMRWKIKEGDLRTVMEESGNAYLSSEKIKVASFFGVKYYLAVYPNKIQDGNQPGTFVYLYLDRDEKEKKTILVSFNIYVNAVNYSSVLQRDEDKGYGRGYRLCSTSDLFDPSKKFIVDGYLTVELKGILKKEKEESVSLYYENGVAPKSALEKNDKDLLIIVGEKQIEVHKKVLIDASPVLSEMLESGTKEAVENKLSIEDFSFRIVEAAIQLCYCTNGCRELIFEEMLSLYKFAKKYRIQFMLDSVEDYLIKEISPSSVVWLLKFSSPDSCNVPKLYQSCIDYVIKCSKDSIPVYASECLDEKLLAEMYLKTLHSSAF